MPEPLSIAASVVGLGTVGANLPHPQSLWFPVSATRSAFHLLHFRKLQISLVDGLKTVNEMGCSRAMIIWRNLVRAKPPMRHLPAILEHHRPKHFRKDFQISRAYNKFARRDSLSLLTSLVMQRAVLSASSNWSLS